MVATRSKKPKLEDDDKSISSATGQVERSSVCLAVDKVISNSLLLDEILSHLSLMDQIRLSKVNSMFRLASQRCQNKRQAFTFFFRHHSKHEQDDDGGFEWNWNSIEKSLHSRPSVCLFMYAMNMRNTANHKLIAPRFPIGTCGISNYVDTALIATDEDYHINEVCIHRTSARVLGHLFIPINKRSLFTVETYAGKRELKEKLAKSVTDNRPVKCVLLFTNSENKQNYESLHKMLFEEKHEFALGGIKCIQLMSGTCSTNHFEMDKNTMNGLIFSGEQVKAASLVIETYEKPLIEQQLIEFKNSLDFDPYDTNRQTMAFIFVCINRLHYFDPDLPDSGIFQKYFPKIHILGAYGYGEIGYNYMTYKSKEGNSINSLNRTNQLLQIESENLDFAYSSVFVLVSLPLK